ncbi:MAG TPA: DUF2339 domain-containing protein [Candidatus Methylacidiphilales bacterium]|jgi:hypothetical protein|nr:DUF2339 domain-containing protein [Candidatus Methylacidiphilales bacterium]
MNAQDRQLLDALNRRHERLETALAELKADLQTFTARFDVPDFVPPPRVAEIAPEPPVVLPPPLPVLAETVAPPPLPPIPAPFPDFPPEAPAIPAAAESPNLEIQFGRWLARIGVVFALLTLVFVSVLAYQKFHEYVGPWSKLTLFMLVSVGLIGGGLRLERRSRDLVVYGRTLAGGGLACLYYTLYGATYVPQLQVIHNVYLGAILLLAWSAGVLALAERRKSELLSIFAISLAYFSSAITPVGNFTMAADLLLAVTAVIFLVRNAWTGLSYLCLIGTYLGFVRQILSPGSEFVLDFQLVHAPDFWPWAIYLTGAWLIFTAGVFLANAPGFDGGKRLAFLSLNNGAWAGLLVIAAELSSHGHIGGMLMLVGVALLAASALAQLRRTEARELFDAYLLQGLAIGTLGIVIAYSGVTRGLILTAESVFLAAAGAYSRNLFLRLGAGGAALLGTLALGAEIVLGHDHPWLLTFGGATAMLINAWLGRCDSWREPFEAARARFVPASAGFIVLALGLILTGIATRAGNSWIAPDLALTSLALAASIYAVPLFELPPLGQLLLIVAQIFSFVLPFGYEPNVPHDYEIIAYQPLWSQEIVAGVTMLLVLWWPRQTRVVKGWWLTPLMWLYALAMVAFTYDVVHPRVDNQTWMMSTALLSLVFLAFGAWNRAWSFVATGQILLALSIFAYLHPEYGFDFPWTWWASLVPITVVFLTGWVAHQVLAYAFNGDGTMLSNLRVAARFYQTLAIAMLVRWIFGIVPTDEITLTLFALATALLGIGVLGSSSYFLRAGLVLDVVGCCNYVFAGPDIDVHRFTWLDAGAVALLLAQPALLRHWARELISESESTVVILISSALAWLFVSNSITGFGSHNLTLGWALLALALIVIGFAAQERRQRWCGLGILAVAFVRVAVHDFWGFSDVGKVLTFFALTVICLGLSFLYYKFAERFKEWL